MCIRDSPRNLPDKAILENLNAKIQSPTVEANIRLVASAPTESEAERILVDLESAFNQFENTGSNRVSFTRMKGRELKKVLREFSFRVFENSQKMPLNIREITTMLHLPSGEMRASPGVKISKSGTAPAPLGLPTEGTVSYTHLTLPTKRIV